MAEVKVRTDWKKKAADLESMLVDHVVAYGNLESKHDAIERAYTDVMETYQHAMTDLQLAIHSLGQKRFVKRRDYEKAFLKFFADMRTAVSSGETTFPTHLLGDLSEKVTI